jgi:hypothetical protein
VFELARAAGVDANRLFEIRNRPLSSGSWDTLSSLSYWAIVWA